MIIRCTWFVWNKVIVITSCYNLLKCWRFKLNFYNFISIAITFSIYQTFLFHNSCDYCKHNHQQIKLNKDFRKYQKVHNRSKMRLNRCTSNSGPSINMSFVYHWLYLATVYFFYLYLPFLRNGSCVSFISSLHNLFPGCELTAWIIF